MASDNSEYELPLRTSSASLFKPKRSLSGIDQGIAIALAINTRWEFQGKCKRVYARDSITESGKKVINFQFDNSDSAKNFTKKYNITYISGTLVVAEEHVAKSIFKDLDRDAERTWNNLTAIAPAITTTTTPKEEDKLLPTPSPSENKKSCCVIL
jgi:hypothetical protein